MRQSSQYGHQEAAHETTTTFAQIPRHGLCNSTDTRFHQRSQQIHRRCCCTTALSPKNLRNPLRDMCSGAGCHRDSSVGLEWATWRWWHRAYSPRSILTASTLVFQSAAMRYDDGEVSKCQKLLPVCVTYMFPKPSLHPAEYSSSRRAAKAAVPFRSPLCRLLTSASAQQTRRGEATGEALSSRQHFTPKRDGVQ